MLPSHLYPAIKNRNGIDPLYFCLWLLQPNLLGNTINSIVFGVNQTMLPDISDKNNGFMDKNIFLILGGIWRPYYKKRRAGGIRNSLLDTSSMGLFFAQKGHELIGAGRSAPKTYHTVQTFKISGKD